jgi:hypothetical protein
VVKGIRNIFRVLYNQMLMNTIEIICVLFNAVVTECEQSRVAYNMALMGYGIPFGRSCVYLE